MFGESWSRLLAVALLALPGCGSFPHSKVSSETANKNLQVLPSDIDHDALIEAMLENLLGLGLRRRDGEGCLYCHVGDLKEPRSTWDYASDAKVEKRKARAMMAMVADINDRLSRLENRMTPPQKVTCATCHAGRIDPRPLPDLLSSTYQEGGIDATINRYERLRERYYASDAYDFRPGVLANLAEKLAATGAFADALALAKANLAVYPGDVVANQVIIEIELYQSYSQGGTTLALGKFDELSNSDRSEWLSYLILDSLGWTLHRKGEKEAAVAIFRRNLERFPEEYIPHESLADALIFAGERQTGMDLYQKWLDTHPDHEIARRRLAGLKSPGGS